ncbi:Malectin-like domain - like 10 [Theobroma cacao]|nr:Malectin-like domain - like 10 [Theobroma cacao]
METFSHLGSSDHMLGDDSHLVKEAKARQDLSPFETGSESGSSKHDTWDWVRIDCGSDSTYKDANGDTWKADDDFIKTGNNKQVPQSSSSKVEQLNTLRVFMEQNKNCYTLPTPTSTRYLVRAMFLYGNYDGLSKPPTFDLEFDGNKWASVVTTMTSFTYYEMIYATKGDSISICLARTQDQQFPFISRLESLPLPADMYPQMRRDMAWFNSYRYNYGANDQILGYPDDKYNRIWEPMIPSGLEPVTANFTSLDVTCVNAPPDSAIITAVHAPSSTDTIDLSFPFGNVSHLDHVEMYFTEPFLATNASRSFNVTVNNVFVANATSPEYQNCLNVGTNSLSVGNLDVQLLPTDISTLPPIISAIEVYTVSEPLVTATTPQGDLDGLGEFVDTFEQLEGWSGEPCLPNNSIWQWLICSSDQPPRVISIYLSGYGLQGFLPDFSHMDALEIIDLRDNDFYGNVPQTITDNKQIKYMIDGNENLGQGKNEKAEKIGLSLGSILVLCLVIFLVLKYGIRKKPTPTGKIETIRDENDPAERLTYRYEWRLWRVQRVLKCSTFFPHSMASLTHLIKQVLRPMALKLVPLTNNT